MVVVSLLAAVIYPRVSWRLLVARRCWRLLPWATQKFALRGQWQYRECFAKLLTAAQRVGRFQRSARIDMDNRAGRCR